MLSSVISEGDTTRSQSEYLSLSQSCLVVLITIQEASVVMIVNKHAESVNVLEMTGFLVVAISDAVHRLAGAEDIAD